MVITIVWTMVNETMTTLFEEMTASVTKDAIDDDHGPEEISQRGFREGGPDKRRCDGDRVWVSRKSGRCWLI